LVGNRGRRIGNGLLVADVGRHCEGGAAIGLDLGGNRATRLLVEVDDGHGVAVGCESCRDRGADASCRAGDDGGAPVVTHAEICPSTRVFIANRVARRRWLLQEACDGLLGVH
jgi:hypothetical protein